MTADAKAGKIATLLDTLPTARPQRTNYFEEGRKASWLDPQAILIRFPKIYALFQGYLSPCWTLKNWKSDLPDPQTHVLVNMGCGSRQLHPAVLNVDFVDFPHVDIHADFSRPLPIRTASVDGVLSIAVLEHLEKPLLMISEITRILKPGGVLYITVPFLYPFHAAPADYNRWTAEGIKLQLGGQFEVTSSESCGAAVGVLILVFSHIVAQILSFGSERLYLLANYSMMGLLAPLKLFDLLLTHLPFSKTLCPCVTLVARRK